MAFVQSMFLKYQLPSDPNVYVDLLDDEDVQLMFDEVSFIPILLWDFVSVSPV